MDCSNLGFHVHHHLPEFAQTHVHWVKDAIQPSHPLSSPCPPAFNLSQHQGLFQWISSLDQVAKVLEFQLQHQSFQWIFRTDFLQDWLVWSPCLPRDSQESSPTPQFEGINSSALSLFHYPALTSVNCIQLHNWGQHVGPLDSSLFVSLIIWTMKSWSSDVYRSQYGCSIFQEGGREDRTRDKALVLTFRPQLHRRIWKVSSRSKIQQLWMSKFWHSSSLALGWLNFLQ